MACVENRWWILQGTVDLRAGRFERADEAQILVPSAAMPETGDDFHMSKVHIRCIGVAGRRAVERLDGLCVLYDAACGG